MAGRPWRRGAGSRKGPPTGICSIALLPKTQYSMKDTQVGWGLLGLPPPHALGQVESRFSPTGTITTLSRIEGLQSASQY